MSGRVVDLTTTDGLLEHLQSLPSANLRAIAARPVWDVESAKLALAAGLVLDARELQS